jgi:hypothetical protein
MIRTSPRLNKIMVTMIEIVARQIVPVTIGICPNNYVESREILLSVGFRDADLNGGNIITI